MDYRRLGDADLADFAKNVATQLTTGTIPGIDTTLATELSTGVTGIATPFETSIEDSVQQTAEKLSKTAAKAEYRVELIDKLSTVRNYLVAGGAAKKDFDRCGFNYPRSAGVVIAVAPSDLSAAGTSNGVNSLKFAGNNRGGSVVYEIWRLEGDTESFRLIGTTKRQNYSDSPVTPGQVYNYKVRAVAATTVSAFSNVAVVYGAI